MDWRVAVAVSVVAVGFGIGWLDTGTLGGAVFAAVFVSVLFVVGWLIEEYIYGL